MKKILVSAAVLSAVLMSSCGTSGKSVDLSGEWNIVAVEGQSISGESSPFIGFNIEEGRIYGNAGCNRIMGSVAIDTINPGQMHLSQVGATRMMCPDMNTEQKVLAALNNVSGFQASANGVELTDKSGKVVISLEKRDSEVAPVSESVSVNALEGEWIIKTVDGAAVEVADKTPFLAFNVEEKTVHGNAGCNIVNGSFSQEEGKSESLKFGQMISTMMAGPGMETEGKVLAALNTVVSFALNADGTLSLKNSDNVDVLVLEKNTGESLSK